jgi:hypothetical protein
VEARHLKVSLYQQDTDSSSWNHTRVVAVLPVAVPADMQASRNNRRLVDFCNPDMQQAVPRVQQTVAAPGIVSVQDSSSRMEEVRRVVGARAFRVVDDCSVSLQQVHFPRLQSGCGLRRMVL